MNPITSLVLSDIETLGLVLIIWAIFYGLYDLTQKNNA